MALLGRYLSPVACDPCVEGLPLLVLHFCCVHAFRLCCGFFKFDISFSLSNLSKVFSGANQPFKNVSILFGIIDREPNPCTHRLLSCTEEPSSEPYGHSIDPEHPPYRQP